VEATNKTIFKILKKKLDDRKGDWAEDLPEVLWAYRTTKKTTTEETPYALAFGTEAVILAKIGSRIYRVGAFRPKTNDQGLKLHLDLLQERRDQAEAMMAMHQEQTTQYFNRKVQHKSFKVGDWVLRKVIIATKDSAGGKLAPSWEGPYRIDECHRAGAYHLENPERKALLRPWNARNLKKYFMY
jgi:hypothetical protein